MKIFKIDPGYTPVTYKLEKNNKPIKNIKIGEEGRGRKQVIIPVIGFGPYIKIKKTSRGVVIFRTKEDYDPKSCIAVIDTVGGYKKGRRYDIQNATGVQIIEEGYYAFGDAGRVGGGPEYLAKIYKGAEFMLNTKYASHWYTWDGKKWNHFTEAEWNAWLVQKEIENGEGEWI